MTPALDDLLANRLTAKLTFVEPWPALAADGTPMDAVVQVTLTVDHAIALAHRSASILRRPLSTDRELLDDFIAVHWAIPLDDDSRRAICEKPPSNK